MPDHHHMPPSRQRTGLTLVETVLSVVIMTTMIVMALGTFGTLVKSGKTNNSRLLATALAQQLAAEIVQNPYSDPTVPNVFGLETGEANGTRANFDDVDDYNAWTESPPQLKDGTTIAGLTGWTRQVAVEWLDGDTLATSTTDKGLKKITVTVTDPQNVKTSVVTLRSSAGTYDQKPAQTTSALRWVGVELQIGSDSANKMVSGTHVLCIVPG